MRLLLPAILIGSALACSANQALDAGDPSLDTSDTGDTDTPLEPPQQWFSVVEGQLDLSDADATQGTITIALLENDESGNPIELCRDEFSVDQPAPVDQPDDAVVLFGMWTLPLDQPACAGLPAELELGIGPLLPDLWPSAEARGYSLRHTRGLYLPTPQRDGLVVFGLAGTQAQLDGLGAPPSLEALPDGTYLVSGSYLLPL